MVSAGAKVLGSITIGDNTKIGAGSVVLQEVPPNSTVVGVPGRVVKRNNIRVPQEELDQIHLPDPVLNDILLLKKENQNLRQKLNELEAKLDQFENLENDNKGDLYDKLGFRDNVCCIFEERSKTAS